MSTTLHPASQWQAHLLEYRALIALSNADEAFGIYAKATIQDDAAEYVHRQKYGDTALHLLPAQAQVARRAAINFSNDAASAHYDNFHLPAMHAAIKLALTDAPDMAAAEYKVELIKLHELDNNIFMVSPPMDVVAQDIARLRIVQ